jgi:hypothetical protein
VTGTPSQAPRSPLATVARALAWLLVALLIAAGAAGIAAGADHPPGDATRPELTWRADAAFTSALGDLDAPLGALAADVDALAGVARDALVDTVARRDDLVAADLQRGDGLVASIERRAAEVHGLVDGLPIGAQPGALGDAAQLKLEAAIDAVAEVEPLPSSWRALADSTLPPLGVARLIDEHDRATFDATQEGVAGRFLLALDGLDSAGGVLGEIRSLRAGLPPTADVSTLVAWLEVADTYDHALASLYRELVTSGGQMTDAAKAALAGVEQAQARLPPDAKAVTVIMGELAQGGLNQAAIAIEEARGALAAAIAALD